MSFFDFDANVRKAKLRPPTALEKLSDKMAAQVSVNLLTGIKRFKWNLPKGSLEDAVKTGSLGHMTKVISWENGLDDLLPAFKRLEDSFEKSGMISLEALPAPIKNNMRIDLKNPALKKFIDDRVSKFLQDLNNESAKIVQRSIQRSFSNALTPRDVANEIVQHIGLNDRQSIALTNYQMSLQEKGMSPDKVEKLTNSYEDRLLHQRATAIARTEIQDANNAGQLAVWKVAQDEGLLNADETFKVWENDRSPCPLCRKMQGKKVKLSERWTLPDGRTVNVPSEIHTHCQCFQTLEL